MMFNKQRLTYLALTIILFLLAACSTGTGTDTDGTVTTDVPPDAVMAAQTWVAQQLGEAVEQVELVSIEQMEWTDSCLGLGQANESCAQVITPGWRAVFMVNGEEFEVRTDETGTVIRSAQIVPAE